jgi:hypothetical protein
VETRNRSRDDARATPAQSLQRGGICYELKRDLLLDDERHAFLELSKGKLTTDPQHHTGEGIFFASRVFDQFTLRAGYLRFSHHTLTGNWWLANHVNVKGKPQKNAKHAKFFRFLGAWRSWRLDVNVWAAGFKTLSQTI